MIATAGSAIEVVTFWPPRSPVPDHQKLATLATFEHYKHFKNAARSFFSSSVS